ncbi:MAG TPA: nucleotidyltransferase family protein [Geothrix sp.]|nr:nucleotidyltransferase family protein [Geothrix sp.]
MKRESIPALILAAGSGKRMGGPKALRIWEGETLLHRTARIALTAGCQPVLAVVGNWDAGAIELPLQLIANPEAAEGMASSIRAGVAALPPGAKGVLLLTVDQIRLNEAVLRQLLGNFLETPDQPIACAYAGTLGIPAVLPRRLFPALLALRGDRGAKGILLQEEALAIPFPGGEEDLDTPQDLLTFRR